MFMHVKRMHWILEKDKHEDGIGEFSTWTWNHAATVYEILASLLTKHPFNYLLWPSEKATCTNKMLWHAMLCIYVSISEQKWYHGKY